LVCVLLLDNVRKRSNLHNARKRTSLQNVRFLCCQPCVLPHNSAALALVACVHSTTSRLSLKSAGQHCIRTRERVVSARFVRSNRRLCPHRSLVGCASSRVRHRPCLRQCSPGFTSNFRYFSQWGRVVSISFARREKVCIVVLLFRRRFVFAYAIARSL